MRGWRVAVGPPVVMMPPAPTATAQCPEPTLTVSESSLSVVGAPNAAATTTAPNVSINFAETVPVTNGSAAALAPVTSSSAILSVTAATTASAVATVPGFALKPDAFTAPTASASTANPNVVLAAVPTPATASASAENPKLAVSFNSASGSASSIAGFNSSHTQSWTHTPAAAGGDRAAIVIALLVTPGGASNSVTASYGGQSMTLLGVASFESGANRFAIFQILNPLSGARTVSVTWSGLGSTTPSKQISCAVSLYNNVGSVTGLVTANAQPLGASSTVTLPSVNPGEMAVFGHARVESTAFSSYNRTQRYTGAASFARVLIGDGQVAAAGSLTSTASMSSSDYHGAHAIRLLP